MGCYRDNVFQTPYWEKYAESILPGLSEKMLDILHTDPDVSVIFYLGLCSGARWATELDGKPLVLLGVEKIIELSWYDKSDMAGLIYHELGYIWHNNMRKKQPDLFKTRHYSNYTAKARRCILSS